MHSPTLGDSVPRPLGVPRGPGDTSTCTTSSTHRGKAPPVDQFDGESAEVRFDDWFPMLQRTAKWNGWSDEEALLQLAGHLRKRALLEWNLLGEAHKTTLSTAVTALRERLDPGSRSTAVQDFRHARQRESEGFHSPCRADIPFCLWTRQPVGRNERCSIARTVTGRIIVSLDGGPSSFWRSEVHRVMHGGPQRGETSGEPEETTVVPTHTHH